MYLRYNTFKKRLSHVHKLIDLASDKVSSNIYISTTGYIHIFLYNSDNKIIGTAEFADYLSEEEMSQSYKQLLDIINESK